MSPAAQLHLHHSLDTPLPVRAVEGVLRIKGWCFTEGGGGGLQVKLQAGPVTLIAPAFDRRDDVAAAFPKISHAAVSGFEISGHVPAGLFVAELWAGREGFGWQRLLSFSVYSEAAVLHGAIDLPAEKEIAANVSIDGWCFHPQREIAELWLHYGTSRVRCVHYGHERKDVARQFPYLPQARFSGFSSEAILLAGNGPIRLRAIDRDGGEFYCTTQHVMRLKPAPSIHASLDSRLDGRALFQAFSSRQSSLPKLKLVLPFSEPKAIDAIIDALSVLTSDRLSVVVVSDSPADLTASMGKNARVSITRELSRDSSDWYCCLRKGDTPNIHGLLAGWLCAAEHPELDAIVGDFIEGSPGNVSLQPPWSRDLALSGGIHPWAPVFVRGSLPLELSPPPVIQLAARRKAKVAHLRAVLVHRAASTATNFEELRPLLQSVRPAAVVSTATGPTRVSFSPGSDFRRPTITAIVLGGEANTLPTLKRLFPDSVDHWLFAEDLTSLNPAIGSTSDSHLLFLTPGCTPASESLVATLALYLESSPESAVIPLLLQPDFAPWSDTDHFTRRTLRTLGAFDPAYAFWSDRSLTLFSRASAYATLPGLFISRKRWQELGGIDSHFKSIAGAMLDLSFRLRAAGTPPLISADARLIARPCAALSAFEETLLLDRWDRNEINPLRIRPLVIPEVMA